MTTFNSNEANWQQIAGVPPPPAITSDIPPEAATWIEMAAAALFGAANMGDPADEAEALEGHGKRSEKAGRAAGEFGASDEQQAQGMDQMAQQLPQMMSSVAGALSGAVGGVMQPLTQMPQQLAQTAQQLLQSGMGAFGKGGAGGLGEADLMAGDLGEDLGGGGAGLGDVGAGGGGSGGGGVGAGGGGIGTTPMAMLGPPATPAATTAPTAGRVTAGPPAVAATTAHPPTAMGGMGGVPMMPHGMHGGGAGGKEDKAATKRVSVPVVKNGAPIQGRISAPPTPVVTKTVEAEKKPTTRRIVIPGARAEKSDD